MLEDAGSLCADFLCTNRTGNICLVDFQLSTVALPNQIADVLGVVGAVIYHRQKNPFNPQFRVDLSLDLVDGSKQLFQTLCRKVCCLNRYQHIVGSCQRIHGQHTQRRHTVQKNEIVILFDRIQVLTKNGFPAHGIYQRDLQTRQFNVCRHQIHALRMMNNPFAGSNGFLHHNLSHQIGKCWRQVIRVWVAKTDR